MSKPGGSDRQAIDEGPTVDIQLIDSDQWLTSCDQEALIAGTNLALLGNEIIQFGDALPIGPGRFRLARLVRGCGGTEWAIGAHSIGDRFLLLDQHRVTPVAMPGWMHGSKVTAVAIGSRSPERCAAITVAQKEIARSAAGTAVDEEARAAISAILETLREQGLIENVKK